MPTFTYRCKECGEEFDVLVLRASQEVRCPKCGGKELERVMKAPRVGSGKGGGSCSLTYCPPT